MRWLQSRNKFDRQDITISNLGQLSTVAKLVPRFSYLIQDIQIRKNRRAGTTYIKDNMDMFIYTITFTYIHCNDNTWTVTKTKQKRILTPKNLQPVISSRASEGQFTKSFKVDNLQTEEYRVQITTPVHYYWPFSFKVYAGECVDTLSKPFSQKYWFAIN